LPVFDVESFVFDAATRGFAAVGALRAGFDAPAGAVFAVVAFFAEVLDAGAFSAGALDVREVRDASPLAGAFAFAVVLFASDARTEASALAGAFAVVFFIATDVFLSFCIEAGFVAPDFATVAFAFDGSPVLFATAFVPAFEALAFPDVAAAAFSCAVDRDDEAALDGARFAAVLSEPPLDALPTGFLRAVLDAETDLFATADSELGFFSARDEGSFRLALAGLDDSTCFVDALATVLPSATKCCEPSGGTVSSAGCRACSAMCVSSCAGVSSFSVNIFMTIITTHAAI
jgi:hypothetical protein